MNARIQTTGYDRRKFVGTAVKVITLGSFLSPVLSACGNKKSGNTGKGSVTRKSTAAKASTKQPRKKWHHENLVMNSRSKVMHFPTSRVYHYYDEIKPNHLQPVALATWSNHLQDDQVRFNKEQSGIIIEILTMQHLRGELTDSSFIMAIDSLSTAFDTNYVVANAKNFRLHELMLQLIALNNSIPADQKWITFNTKLKKPGQLRKRQQWMANETNFTERVNYILGKREEYHARLNQRASKYIFT